MIPLSYQIEVINKHKRKRSTEPCDGLGPRVLSYLSMGMRCTSLMLNVHSIIKLKSLLCT